MERTRKTAAKRRPPQNRAPEKTGYGGRLMLRIFGSVFLILAAIFIKQNAPEAAEAARHALFVWSMPLP